MSGQAEQMKGMVDELSALVGGSGNASKRVSRTRVTGYRSTDQVAATRKVKAHKVIPMDDGDFKDF
jgi:hypothetical protein